MAPAIVQSLAPESLQGHAVPVSILLGDTRVALARNQRLVAAALIPRV